MAVGGILSRNIAALNATLANLATGRTFQRLAQGPPTLSAQPAQSPMIAMLSAYARTTGATGSGPPPLPLPPPPPPISVASLQGLSNIGRAAAGKVNWLHDTATSAHQKLANIPGMGQLGSGLKQSMTSPIKGAGEAAGGVGSALMASGNPYAMAAGAALKLGGALVSSVSKVKEWGDSLHAANMELAPYSASMAAVGAKADMERMNLSFAKGEALAPSADYLAESKASMNRSTAPAEVAISKGWNSFVGRLSQGVGNYVAAATGHMTDPDKQLAEYYKENQEGWTSKQREDVNEILKKDTGRTGEQLVKELEKEDPSFRGDNLNTNNWLNDVMKQNNVMDTYGRPKRFI